MKDIHFPRVLSLECMSAEQRREAVRLARLEMEKTYHITTDPSQLDMRTWDDCMGKSVRLQKSLAAIGVTTFFGICEFRWDDCNLPPQVKLHLGDDNGTHMFLLYDWENPEGEVSRRILDVTWSVNLATGLLVYPWDGEQGTPLTVLATSLPRVFDPRIEADLVHILDTSWVADDLARNTDFYTALNRYCASFPL